MADPTRKKKGWKRRHPVLTIALLPVIITWTTIRISLKVTAWSVRTTHNLNKRRRQRKRAKRQQAIDRQRRIEWEAQQWRNLQRQLYIQQQRQAKLQDKHKPRQRWLKCRRPPPVPPKDIPIAPTSRWNLGSAFSILHPAPPPPPPPQPLSRWSTLGSAFSILHPPPAPPMPPPPPPSLLSPQWSHFSLHSRTHTPPIPTPQHSPQPSPRLLSRLSLHSNHSLQVPHPTSHASAQQ
ncbi:hypothetical protein RSOLAG22IIIB_08261 [Rhizoctonia solani]|uniref:Uncharacterized protein n=1 Tax=Rhizoctonia solani TaxID=456999 RepID=A0A0K6FRZ4_9AGAM|nr:hypothetical protein RSOLAG22IIIB_08261 [Rhizoctonia solani]